LKNVSIVIINKKRNITEAIGGHDCCWW